MRIEVDKDLVQPLKEFCKNNGIKPAGFVNSLIENGLQQPPPPVRVVAEPEAEPAPAAEVTATVEVAPVVEIVATPEVTPADTFGEETVPQDVAAVAH